MIVGNRQSYFDVGNVPKVKLVKKPCTGDYKDIYELMVKALIEKYGNNDYDNWVHEGVKNGVGQSLHYLRKHNMLKMPKKRPTKIKLWDKMEDLGKFYEGVCVGIVEPLYKQHYPGMHTGMAKGRIMSHWGLTVIHNSVEYVFEYLKREKLLKEMKNE